jgi:predicted dehydrogenase
MTTTKRIGVLGTGRQAREHRIAALLDVCAREDAELVAVADIDVAAANRAIEGLARQDVRQQLRDAGYAGTVPGDVTVFGSLPEMIRNARLDGVIITTPHASHAADTVMALEAGLHVKVEKPMATTTSDAARMVSAARENRRLLTVGYQNAFALHGLPGGANGAHAFWRRQDGIPDAPHFWDDEITGGVRPDLCGHLTAPLILVFGPDVAWVRASARNDLGRARYGDAFKADDTVDAVIGWKNGAVASLHATWADEVPWDEEAGFSVYWDDTRAEIPLVPQKYAGYQPDTRAFQPAFRTEGGAEPTRLDTAPPSYAQLILAQTSNWVRAILGTEALAFTGEHALSVERTVDAIGKAVTAGTRIEVDRI